MFVDRAVNLILSSSKLDRLVQWVMVAWLVTLATVQMGKAV